MKEATPTGRTPRMVGQKHPPGSYVSCVACGRLLRIGWATRSIICACGAKVPQAPPPEKQG